jgi:hypothetical protein
MKIQSQTHDRTKDEANGRKFSVRESNCVEPHHSYYGCTGKMYFNVVQRRDSMIPERGHTNLGKRARRAVATATALTFLCQNFAWALCADGSTFPAGGFAFPQPPTATWSSGIFTEAAGSIFVPDNSVFEHNNPAEPLTGGGHNWVLDQGSTLCKAIDVGPAGGTPTGWTIPPSNTADCIILPTPGPGVPDIPYQGEAITPSCNPALLSQPGAPNPANTRLNQLGCAISHGVATTPQSATTYMFVAGITSGLFAVPLVNVPNPVVGGDAGKMVDPAYTFGTYSDIPGGQKLQSAAVSPDGIFAMSTSTRRLQPVFACLNPLGDPGDPSQPIDPNFVIPPPSQVKCMAVGNNNLIADLTTAFGPDVQPYFGGARTVNSFNSDPGGSSPTAWPQCTFNGFIFSNPPPTTLMGKLQAVFNAHSANRCGNAVTNPSFAGITQPPAIISHGSYMYVAAVTGTVVQFKVTVDPVSGLSQYAHRTYLSGTSINTGLGVADDLGSLMTFTDPSGLGLAGQAIIIKAPLCEDM